MKHTLQMDDVVPPCCDSTLALMTDSDPRIDPPLPSFQMLNRARQLPNMLLSSVQRRLYLAFLLDAIRKLSFKPHRLTKYCAVLFFHERYLPFLESQQKSCPTETTDVHIYSLICLWIASKIHETSPISIGMLQNLAKLLISEHHYSRKYIVNAEIKLMKAIGFDLRSGPLVSAYIEDLLAEFSQTSEREGIVVSLKLCLSILDLLYLREDEVLKNLPTELSGASILAAAYMLGVPPNSQCVFPIFTWLQQQTNSSIAEQKECTRKILGYIPDGVRRESAIAQLEGME